MNHRPRRLRQSATLRDGIAEVHLRRSQFIQPYFLTTPGDSTHPIPGFTDVQAWSTSDLLRKVELDLERGLNQFLLFGGATDKDALGSPSTDKSKSSILSALPELRKQFGDSGLFITDVCLCPYTSHGHCGTLGDKDVDNDASVDRLKAMALAHAQAGAQFVAPSDMMDGRIGAIRTHLDSHGFVHVGILAYTAKYASHYYGPFRNALDSSPQFGDRKTYQMDFRNSLDALRELELDLAEGADLVMVKPALAYLDIIAQLAARSTVPVVAYQVSGEYEMLQGLAKAGLAPLEGIVIETLSAIRRAGAQLIVSYFASTAAEKGWITK